MMACMPLSAAKVFDFSHGAVDWMTYNYKSRVSFCVTNIDGVAGFSVYVPGVQTPKTFRERMKLPDTAWGVGSPLVDVVPGQGFSLSLKLRSTVDVRRPSGSDSASCYVSFFGKDGRELPDYVPFSLVQASNAWQTITVYGRVPHEATRMHIQFGCDVPNLAPGDSIVLSKLELVSYPGGPSPDCRVTLRDDGGVLVGGRPFFPIGIFNVNACTLNGDDLRVGMRELRDAGVNLVHTYRVSRDGRLQRFMDAAHEAGLKTWVPAGGSNFEFKEKYILADRSHPSILAWYLGDDTGNSVTSAEVFRRHEICHSLDPDRITVQADYLHGRRSSRYLNYVNMTDAFMPEIYTAFMKEPTGKEVPDIIGDMNTVKACIRLKGSPNKSVWPIIQYFEGWRDWLRYPTAKELRAMTFAAITSGAKGVIYYTYCDSKVERADGWCGHGAAHSRDHFNTFSAVTRELAGLIPDLVSRDAPRQPAVEMLSGPAQDANGGFPVSCLLKETGLLVVVNSATKPVSAKLTLPGGKSRTVELDAIGVSVIRTNAD